MDLEITNNSYNGIWISWVRFNRELKHFNKFIDKSQRIWMKIFTFTDFLEASSIFAPNVENKDGSNENQAQNQNDNGIT